MCGGVWVGVRWPSEKDQINSSLYQGEHKVINSYCSKIILSIRQ